MYIAIKFTSVYRYYVRQGDPLDLCMMLKLLADRAPSVRRPLNETVVDWPLAQIDSTSLSPEHAHPVKIPYVIVSLMVPTRKIRPREGRISPGTEGI